MLQIIVLSRKADLIESDISVEKSEETANFISALQQERSAALMTLFLRENFNSDTEKINFNIESLRLKTDIALENITEWRVVQQLVSKVLLTIMIEFHMLQIAYLGSMN